MWTLDKYRMSLVRQDLHNLKTTSEFALFLLQLQCAAYQVGQADEL